MRLVSGWLVCVSAAVVIAGAIMATPYPSPTHFIQIALASDRRDFLVVTSIYKEAVTARFLRSNGSLHGNLALDGGVEFLSSAI